MEERRKDLKPVISKPGIAARRRLIFGDFVLYPADQKLFYQDTLCQLEPKMLRLISLLIEVRPECVSKDTLMKNLWPDSSVSDWSLARLVSDTRKLIEYDGQQQSIIKTVRGRGFAFIAQTDEIIEAYPSHAISQQEVNKRNLTAKDTIEADVKPLSRLSVVLMVSVVLAFVFFISLNPFSISQQPVLKVEHGTLKHQIDIMRDVQTNLNLTKTTFFAQLRRRNELNKLLLEKFPEDVDLSSENRIRLRYPSLTENELFIFDQIRAMTEGPMHQGNKAIIDLLAMHPELFKELSVFTPLNSHLKIWQNKFDKIFLPRKDMCLVYVGTEDGVPFPSDVDALVEGWLKEKQLTDSLSLKISPNVY